MCSLGALSFEEDCCLIQQVGPNEKLWVLLKVILSLGTNPEGSPKEGAACQRLAPRYHQCNLLMKQTELTAHPGKKEHSLPNFGKVP